MNNVRKCRINKQKLATSTKHGYRPRKINIHNLITIRTIDFGGTVTTYLTIATLNARSVKNKDQLLFQELSNNSIDIGLITETWLKDTQEDEAWVIQSALQQNSYKTLLHNRPGDHHGGALAPIHKNHIPTKELEKGNTLTIEYAVWKATVHNQTIHLMDIYHPPPGSTNKTMTCMFIDEMTDLLTDKIPKYSNLIILEHFNISAENLSKPDTVIFNDTMGALGLQQHVQGPTNIMGNMLDLIFTQLEMQLTVTGAATHGFVPDHCMVSTDLSLKS